MKENKKELQSENLEKAAGGVGPGPQPMRCVCPKCGKFCAVLTFYSGWMGGVFVQYQTIRCDNKACNYFEQIPVE